MTAEFTTGQHIGDYEILSILGMGGMGKVYKVRNVISDRVEAMKILLPDLTSNQGLADRFLREIRLLATLNHPNIAALRTALTYQNQLVMIMEFVEGETLANRIARAPISTADAVNYSDQILSALSYAHKQNIIHRDIKPANMMLTPTGAVKLMDFGIARSSSDHALTNTGTTIGSLNYMPPEQVRGESADARSDIYSYGVSLYELLTGQLPFKGDSHYSLMTAHLKEMPAAPITLRSDLPAALNEIIMMAMAKDPGERFQSAEAFRAALKSVPVSGLPVSNTTMATGPARKSPTMSTAETIVDGPAKQPTSAETLVEPSATPARVPTVPAPVRTPAPTPAPAMAAAAAAPTPAAMTMPAAAMATSGRGLWIALGAILGIGVLIAAGIYIPRRTHTHADPSQSAFPSGASSGSSSPGSGGSLQPAPPAVPPTTPAPVPPDSSAGAGGMAPSVPNTGAGDASGSATAGSGKESASGAGHAGRSGNPKPARGAQGGQSGGGNAQAAPAVPAGPSPAELAKLEDEGDKLSVRASTASQSVETLRRQQMASGYNLRADIAGSAERMQMYVAKGTAALQAHDTVNAQKYFDLADAEISKVEKFLGH
jgi:eukaryotic-like serine/threonine-protein kinase